MIPAFEATVAFAPELAQLRRQDSRPRLRQWLLGWLRPAGAATPESLDRSTGLFNRAGLMAAAEESLRRRGGEVAVSAIVLEFADLREVRDIYGAAIARKVVARLVRRLRAMAGLRGLVGRTGPSQFTAIFVGCAAPRALRNLERGLGKPPRVEFDAGDSEIVLVPELVVDEKGDDEPLHALQRRMARSLARLQNAERRRLDFLTSERERHSRPMGVHP